MIRRNRFFWLYLGCAILLAFPSLLSWSRDPFHITVYEFDFFLGLIPGADSRAHLGVLLLGKTLHLALVVLMGWAYYRLLIALAAAETVPSWAEVAAAGIAASGVVLCYLPWLSPDVFFYFGTGWLDIHYHLNPFAQVIGSLPGRETDPLFQNVYPGWNEIITPYGPLFVKFAALNAWLGAGDDRACLLLIKSVYVLVHFLNAGIVWLIARQLQMKVQVTVLAWLLNPALLLDYLGWGHNDILMLTFLLAAVWALLQQRHALTVLLLGLGVGVKYVPLLLFPLFLAFMLRGRGLLPAVLRGLGLVFVLAAAVLSPYLWYEAGILNFRRLFLGQDQLIVNPVYWLLTRPDSTESTVQWVKLALKVPFLVGYAAYASYLWRRRCPVQPADLFVGIANVLLIYFSIVSPEIHEWYVGWFLCFLLWINDRSYFVLAMVLSTALNALAIFTVRGPVLLLMAAWVCIFACLWLSLHYLYHQTWKQRKHLPSPLFALSVESRPPGESF
jgi:alpha-1,6-mannosyltransferase